MEWEAIVNQHSCDKKVTEHQTRKNKYLKKVTVSALLAVAFIVTALLKLVHPVLSELGMMVCLMIAFFNLGRAKECAKNA